MFIVAFFIQQLIHHPIMLGTRFIQAYMTIKYGDTLSMSRIMPSRNLKIKLFQDIIWDSLNLTYLLDGGILILTRPNLPKFDEFNVHTSTNDSLMSPGAMLLHGESPIILPDCIIDVTNHPHLASSPFMICVHLPKKPQHFGI